MGVLLSVASISRENKDMGTLPSRVFLFYWKMIS